MRASIASHSLYNVHTNHPRGLLKCRGLSRSGRGESQGFPGIPIKLPGMLDAAGPGLAFGQQGLKGS